MRSFQKQTANSSRKQKKITRSKTHTHNCNGYT